jgi:hypothetical protein
VYPGRGSWEVSLVGVLWSLLEDFSWRESHVRSLLEWVSWGVTLRGSLEGFLL